MDQDAAVSGLESHLGYWLRFVSNQVSYEFARKLVAQGVTVAEWAMMRELYGAGALGPSRLAEIMGHTRGAISKLADRLIAKELVQRVDRKDDGRAHVLSLTAAGRNLVPRLAEMADINDSEFFGHLTADERAMVESVMRGIVERRGLKAKPVA